MTVHPPVTGHCDELRDALRTFRDSAHVTERWGAQLARVLTGGGRLPTAGNGGSAAQAQHLTAELVGRYRDDRPAFSAIALHADTSSTTAIADDERVRTAHGTVAAGGCFDLLHAGHVGLLQTARGLGDCLVVCVNSDASVRRRKGAGRPVNPLTDRVRVLRALACVDAVAVFDEDTPERLLADLRPDVRVKGGDYAATDLPEARLLEEWGGQAVLLPYLDGRSSTAMLERAAESTR
ncbi:rfaE bifunctional protein nucleotidyltransferase chain/domain [Streptomyces calvus]|uniref:adenylyltransferase/cytidyltransferase family protein n=1 Tax=Streptomyces calvus TaxID=67282 RepID=UPI003514DEBC